MAKNNRAAADSSSRSQNSGDWVKRDASAGTSTKNSAPLKGARREILFPTEPSTIGHKKIDRAVERVISRKK
jgi:hypothetical protein